MKTDSAAVCCQCFPVAVCSQCFPSLFAASVSRRCLLPASPVAISGIVSCRYLLPVSPVAICWYCFLSLFAASISRRCLLYQCYLPPFALQLAQVFQWFTDVYTSEESVYAPVCSLYASILRTFCTNISRKVSESLVNSNILPTFASQNGRNRLANGSRCHSSVGRAKD